jgi:hypothetical protein
MSYPKHQKNEPISPAKEPVKSLALRMNRAAGDLNPFLVVLAVGLLFLNLTLYLGMSVAHERFAWSQPLRANSYDASVDPPHSPSVFHEGANTGVAGN